MLARLVMIEFADVAARAGFTPGADGRLNLPPEQATCDKLAVAARKIVGPWRVGDPAVEVILTGAGPVWGHLAIAHGLNGCVQRLRYAAPNTPLVQIWGVGWVTVVIPEPTEIS